MRKNRMIILKYLFIFILAFSLSSCTVIFQRGRRSDIEKINLLSGQLDELNQTRRILEQRLSREIADKQVRLEMADRGLIVTVVDEVLFASGKARLKKTAIPILDKVASVLNKNIPNMEIGIEGHTDNVPIRFSRWKSNWELSAARAMSVLHYLVDERGIDPGRISATGFGEHRPIAPNDTKQGRGMNRRVEIVILPKISKEEPISKTDLPKPTQENLK